MNITTETASQPEKLLKKSCFFPSYLRVAVKSGGVEPGERWSFHVGCHQRKVPSFVSACRNGQHVHLQGRLEPVRRRNLGEWSGLWMRERVACIRFWWMVGGRWLNLVTYFIRSQFRISNSKLSQLTNKTQISSLKEKVLTKFFITLSLDEQFPAKDQNVWTFLSFYVIFLHWAASLLVCGGLLFCITELIYCLSCTLNITSDYCPWLTVVIQVFYECIFYIFRQSLVFIHSTIVHNGLRTAVSYSL